MRLQVYNGTPQHNTSLCDTCAHRQQRRGLRSSDDFDGCNEFAGRIRQPVINCTSYYDARLRPPAELSQQAFRWVPSLGTFLSPIEYEMKRMKGKLKPGDCS